MASSKGEGHNKYIVLKRLKYAEVKQAIGTQGMILTLAYGIVIDLIMCVVFIVVGTLFL
jgi:tetrahydromethanopterin S-methyltransferase subunit G